MMKDERLDDLLREAKETYRVPPTPPFEAMWERIERDHFDVPKGVQAVGAPLMGDALVRDAGMRHRAPRRQRWFAPAVGIAATLLVGIGIGRVSVRTDSFAGAEPGAAIGAAGASTSPATGPSAALPLAGASVTPAAAVAEPLQRATYEYLARAVALLDSIPGTGSSLRRDARFVADASQLLGTTRLLLDSPAASDPRMRDLLEDLELVLAQVAGLRTAPRADELTFIAEAMDSRDVVPRLRTVAATYSASGY